MGGASSRNVPTFVRNYEALVARGALPEATRLFDELAPTFMVDPRAQRHEAWEAWWQRNDAIVKLLENIHRADVIVLKNQYSTKAERVDAHNIRDSFVVFVGYLEIPRVEIMVETTVDEFTLTRALTQLFTLRGTLKSVKIISNATHEFRINKAIAASLVPDLVEQMKGTPFFYILKKATPEALAEASMKDWIPSAPVTEGGVITWEFVLDYRKEPEVVVPAPAIEKIVEIVYDLDTEAQKLNNLIISSIEFFAVHRVFATFAIIRKPIVQHWWDKYIQFVRFQGGNNDSLRKWAQNVNAQIRRRGGHAVIYAELPFPTEETPYTFSYHRQLGEGRVQHVGVLTLKRNIRSVITWDVENRLTKIVDRLHTAFKVAVSRLKIKGSYATFPLYGNAFREWYNAHARDLSALAAELTLFCRTNAANAPFLEWNVPQRSVVTVRHTVGTEVGGERTRNLEIMMNGEKWGTLYMKDKADYPFLLGNSLPMENAMTHEIAALIMRYDVDSASDRIPFFQDAFTYWRITDYKLVKEINEDCAMSGSVAKIENTAQTNVYDYYHGTTLVGKLSFEMPDRIQWLDRPAGWQLLNLSWQRV
jgi:hypothetical protein